MSRNAQHGWEVGRERRMAPGSRDKRAVVATLLRDAGVRELNRGCILSKNGLKCTQRVIWYRSCPARDSTLRLTRPAGGMRLVVAVPHASALPALLPETDRNRLCLDVLAMGYVILALSCGDPSKLVSSECCESRSDLLDSRVNTLEHDAFQQPRRPVSRKESHGRSSSAERVKGRGWTDAT